MCSPLFSFHGLSVCVLWSHCWPSLKWKPIPLQSFSVRRTVHKLIAPRDFARKIKAAIEDKTFRAILLAQARIFFSAPLENFKVNETRSLVSAKCNEATVVPGQKYLQVSRIVKTFAEFFGAGKEQKKYSAANENNNKNDNVNEKLRENF